MTPEESKLYDENISYGAHLAVARALDRHKRLGFPIAIMKDDKVVIIPPEDIVVNYPPPEDRPQQLPLANSERTIIANRAVAEPPSNYKKENE
jgi:hypothetical protein